MIAMRVAVTVAALILAAPVAAQPAPPLAERVAQILADAPVGTRFGLLVTTADGREVIAVNPDGRFIPASNTKLFATAAAYALLAELGTGAGGSEQSSSGTIVGLEPTRSGPPDVVLFGRGDARMSSAPDCTIDCLATLADAVARRTRNVRNIVGDDRWFPDQRWSPGMSWNNIGTDSGTATSALSLDDNELPVRVTPAAPGTPPKVEVSTYYTLRNEAVTIAEGKTTLTFERAPNGTELRLYGEIAATTVPYKERLGIDDPAHYAAWTLRRMLEARGVKVRGQITVRHRPVTLGDDPKLRAGHEIQLRMPFAAFIGGHTAPPLAEDIAIINKVSQNLHAELLLRRIGRLNGTGSLADGTAALEQVLTGAGIPRTGYDFSDGSGMSSYNRVSPRAAVTLLRWARTQPWGAEWRASLPIGGTDGTLRRRFDTSPLKGNLWAKTGTLNATNALSGYLRAASGQDLIFSFFANDVPQDAGASATMDAALDLIAAAN